MNNIDSLPEYQVLMSPILSEKFEKIDTEINIIKTAILENNNNNLLLTGLIKDITKENKNIYKKIFLEIQNNNKIIKENSLILQNIDNKIMKLENNIENLENNLNNNYQLNSRIYNHYWRRNAVTHKNNSSILSGIIGLPYLDTTNDEFIFKKN